MNLVLMSIKRYMKVDAFDFDEGHVEGGKYILDDVVYLVAKLNGKNC